jgi:hypothetical protein
MLTPVKNGKTKEDAAHKFLKKGIAPDFMVFVGYSK